VPYREKYDHKNMHFFVDTPTRAHLANNTCKVGIAIHGTQGWQHDCLFDSQDMIQSDKGAIPGLVTPGSEQIPTGQTKTVDGMPELHTKPYTRAEQPACMQHGHLRNQARHLQGEVRSPSQLLLQRGLAVQPQSGVSRIGAHPRADLAHHLYATTAQDGPERKATTPYTYIQLTCLQAWAGADDQLSAAAFPDCSIAQSSGGRQRARTVAASVPAAAVRWVAACTAGV
jgi:hypothetical protein